MNFMNNYNNTNPIIIGIDHGYGNIKTAHCCFKTGVAAYDKEPTFKSNLLVYEGRYYLIGEEHKEFISDKMTDSDYYITPLSNNPIFTTTGGFSMTTDEKKLLQAKHRLEEAEMRDRNKERKARTRRLIQEGAILEKVFPSVASMSLDDVEDFLCGLRR